MYYGGALVADPNNNQTFWQGGIHRVAAPLSYDNYVSKTTDGGTTWERYFLTTCPDFLEAFTYAIAIAPTNSNIVYAGGQYDSTAALYKTVDGGTSWSACTTNGLSGIVYALAIKTDDQNTVYAGTPDGVFKSTDGATTWTNTGLSGVNALLIDPRAPNWIYAGTTTGVYISFSGGNEWEAMNDGLDNLNAFSLTIADDDYLFCGTWGNSMYRCVPSYDDVWPPASPYITRAEKSGNHAVLHWNIVTADTLSNPDSVDHYIIYRNTSPSFIPSSSDSIGVVYAPETTFVDSNVLSGAQDYYYLITATDKRNQTSARSNMAYVFHKSINENADATDRNWVSVPLE